MLFIVCKSLSKNASTCQIYNLLEHLQFYKLCLFFYSTTTSVSAQSKNDGGQAWADGNCSSHLSPPCFTAEGKKNPITFVWKTSCLKLSYVHNDTETLLSPQHCETDDTVTSPVIVDKVFNTDLWLSPQVCDSLFKVLQIQHFWVFW